MVPQNWHYQYELSGALIPQSVRELLEVLECIKKACPIEKVGEGPKNAAKSSDSSTKKMISFSDWIPKRRHTEKYCSLCKKHGGAHTTHNTPDCQKYDSNGTPKKNFKGQNQLEPLVDPRDLLKEEVAMRNYPLKSTNLKSPTRK